MRVTSELWVHAFLRRVAARGGFAVVARKGASEAGAIFIRVENADRLCDLYAPAAQAVYDDRNDTAERRWSRLFGGQPQPPARIEERLAREVGFDPDIWIVDVEDRDGRSFLDDLLARQ